MSERTKSSIDIAAPPEAVLAVITDFEAYPEWAGEVKQARIEERDDAGRATRAWYRMDAGALRDEHTLAYEYPSDVEVRWSLVSSNMMRALDGSYVVEATESGSHVTYQLAVDVKLPMVGLLKRKVEKLIIDRALSGLKKRVEAISA
ncbi:cyclase/dehydrase [Catenulispora acidiphila DSM 44928]|uniref:Cyclase/dehydrase n=1 Tax=Catenulispora acidiphila (strain DSM 44928 / JCM 14897 / NBRC 102108 / NRRL B-24433 / ID139908) TaxID=479433 RepID=C7QGP3_CATAD|nr:SRPBCC family protein [Catenulispora acidiphila]ACU74923.1 cyclase/dehydrase [Catenulispora acidiphila DSM 44928]